MSLTLEGPAFFDIATFALPPKVAKLDAVRKLIPRLMEVTGLGETAATTIAHSVVDPAAVRATLAEPLPGLTATHDAHLQVIPTRVWAPWTVVPADDMARYSSRKIYPIADPSVPAWPQAEEDSNGLLLNWQSAADRNWHLKDNERLYDEDVYSDRLRIFPEKGGIVVPLVMAPQTENFQDGAESLHSLRVADGRRRWYEVQSALRQFAGWERESLASQFGDDVTPEVFQAALERDRTALAKLVNAVRGACVNAGDGNDYRKHTSAHYLAVCLSLPAYIAVGAVRPVTSEFRPMGSGHRKNAATTLHLGVGAWHCGSPARVVATGQQSYGGLLLPEAAVDEELIEVATKRLRVRGVPKDTILFGESPTDVRTAARFVWWCRAIRQLGGTPATAVAAFARHTEPHDGCWPQQISRPLLACATHTMEEDFGSVFPPGDYRDPETLPDSLSLLTSDTKDMKNLIAVAALTSDGRGNTLAHPRWRNAAHIALADLAFKGALPAQEPLPERITGHAQLLSHVAIAWANTQVSVFVRADGEVYRDAEGRVVPIDERTLGRDDLPWPKNQAEIGYLLPPPGGHPYDASHVFKLRHGVVYTIPDRPLDGQSIEATPESLAAVVRRWFPDATGIALTDWSDKFITGVMVGSVWVRLWDRRGEREGARSRGVWYPEGRPPGTKDVLDYESTESGVPVGRVLGAIDFTGFGTTGDLAEIDEEMFEELDNGITQEVDDALEIQKAADSERGSAPNQRYDIPVLRLPETGKGKKR